MDTQTSNKSSIIESIGILDDNNLTNTETVNPFYKKLRKLINLIVNRFLN